MIKLRECIRCGVEFTGGHSYCPSCRTAYKKETPEDRLLWKSQKKIVDRQKATVYQRGWMKSESGWNYRTANWRKLGIINPPETKEEYDELVAANNGICPACHRKVDGKRANGWQLHHDHKTGLVIGVVCAKCNMGMGQFGDDADLMMAVACWMVEQEEREGLYA